ncbi:MAG: hypothetical protein JO023_04955 [Chloroflexi bacterium]|nr:hypothetical protein [Chloroflexota bacterium]
MVRIGGTSDAEFSRALGWQSHGSARQPTAPGASSGSDSTETPDAKALFLAAGVEVLQVRVAALPNWRGPGPVSKLVRSPGNVLYYSGHGRSSGMLALELEPRECPEVGPLADWLGPAEVLAAWPYQLDLEVLILAGCSVLGMSVGPLSGRAAGGPGRAWSRLLTGKGGPLRALLGYGGGAPCDSRGGDLIARAMAERLVAGSTNFVQDWLQANARYRAWNAVAMDNQGYWTIDRRYPTGPAPID